MISHTKLGPHFFKGLGTLQLAPQLLGKQLVHHIDGQRVGGIITEVEAYLQNDPASHTFRGMTGRTKAMFAAPGTIYLYRSYGIHLCLNIVTADEGIGEAVLIRAVYPTEGVTSMRARRGSVAPTQLTNGPGKLTQAFGLTMDLYGQSVFTSPLWLEKGFDITPQEIQSTPRIGISKAQEELYRFLIPEKLIAARLFKA